jgi:ketosteroid isomerase-like protein
MMRHVSLLAVLLLSGTACRSTPPSLSHEQRTEVADSLRDLAHRLADTWNAGEEEAYLDCYLADSTFTFAANGAITRGWLVFADTVRAHRGMLATSTVTYDEMFVDVLGADHGVVTATFHWASVDTSGVEQRLRGTYTTLMSRTGDGWKVINVAESFPLPGQ